MITVEMKRTKSFHNSRHFETDQLNDIAFHRHDAVFATTEAVKLWSHIFMGEKSDTAELSLLHSNLIIHGDNVDSDKHLKV